MKKTFAFLLACASLLGASSVFAHDHDRFGDEPGWHARDRDRAYDRGWHDRGRDDDRGREYDRHWGRDWREVRYLPPPPRYEERGYRYHDPHWVGVPVVEAVPVAIYPRPAITISLPSIVIPLH